MGVKINSQIIKSKALIQWIDQKINGLEIISDDRNLISTACFDIALEHQKAIVLLVANKFFGSAFSLGRILFEAYIRGLWLAVCASEKELEDFKKDKLKKTFDSLIKEIEQQDGFEEGVLSKVKSANWKIMNSYTHSGFSQVIRRYKDRNKAIEPNYAEDEILELLKFSNGIGMLTAMQIASIAGKITLIKELFERLKTELKES